MTPIAYLNSPFKEKFGIPRQASLITKATASIEFDPPYNTPEAFVGLDSFSHLWLQFSFHLNDRPGFKATVRPPRLGGNRKLGVFATRSSFRPNGLGLTLVTLLDIKTENNSTKLIVSCPDLVDGTPIYDVKPFVAYSDMPESPRSGFAEQAPNQRLSISFTESAKTDMSRVNIKNNGGDTLIELSELIEEILSLDPRPAYKPDDDRKTYAMKLYNLDIKWKVSGATAEVFEIKQLD